MDIKTFRRQLLAWYKENKRALPWRKSNNPYWIWVSEIMLQQTQVATVIDYFNRFVKHFPTIHALARADLQDVLKLWEGLGYYSRARNLHKAAKQLVDQGMTDVPDNPSDFLALSGVGPYTCAAVQSISFGHPLAVVDGNVKRVLARMYKLSIPVNDSCVHEDFTKKAQMLLEENDPSTFNQAMMELGSLICKPSSPDCSCCPVSDFCMAFEEECVLDYPKRKKKKPVPERKRVAAFIEKNKTFLVVRRKEEGFLGGLWELPDAALRKNGKPETTLKREIKKKTGLTIEVLDHLTTINHVYSHFKLELSLYRCDCRLDEIQLDGPIDCKWITYDEIKDYAFHKATHKLFESLKRL